jgi:hypothetical protein
MRSCLGLTNGRLHGTMYVALYKLETGWKIAQITEADQAGERHKSGCEW